MEVEKKFKKHGRDIIDDLKNRRSEFLPRLPFLKMPHTFCVGFAAENCQSK